MSGGHFWWVVDGFKFLNYLSTVRSSKNEECKGLRALIESNCPTICLEKFVGLFVGFVLGCEVKLFSNYVQQSYLSWIQQGLLGVLVLKWPCPAHALPAKVHNLCGWTHETNHRVHYITEHITWNSLHTGTIQNGTSATPTQLWLTRTWTMVQSFVLSPHFQWLRRVQHSFTVFRICLVFE